MSTPAVTFPLSTLACTVTPAGITSPAFNDIMASMQASVEAIYGSDVVLDPDSQDGQLLTLLAQAQFDSNMATIAVYNAYNPQSAVGTALDSAIKVNGIRRLVPTKSTVELLITGQAGVQLYGCVVQDTNGILWDLPISVVIPAGGQVRVQATCEELGAIAAGIGTVNTIFTAVLGWQSAVNDRYAAVPGAPVESDGALRIRQTQSTAFNAQTTQDALVAAVANLVGVQRVKIYDNDSTITDVDGIPAHSFGMVISGGNPTEIGQAIADTKDIGAGTAGDTTVTVKDANSDPIDIKFYTLQPHPLAYSIVISRLAGWAPATEQTIANALAAFVNALAIGEDVYYSWSLAAASLTPPLQGTFVITSLTQGPKGGSLGTADIPIAFNQAATLDPADVSFT